MPSKCHGDWDRLQAAEAVCEAYGVIFGMAEETERSSAGPTCDEEMDALIELNKAYRAWVKGQ